MQFEKSLALKVGASILLIAVILFAAQIAGLHLGHAVERGGFHYGQFTLFAAASMIGLILLVGVVFNAIPATGLFTGAIAVLAIILWLLPRIAGGGPPGA